jgi:hypothetical protein
VRREVDMNFGAEKGVAYEWYGIQRGFREALRRESTFSCLHAELVASENSNSLQLQEKLSPKQGILHPK